jgi:DNA-binding transcriptional MerR regulator
VLDVFSLYFSSGRIVVVPTNVDLERKGPSLRKLYYSIGEVSELTGIPAHVLRYWESEFPQLHPKKGRTGNRTYQEKDLETLLKIKALLYDQRFTIAGAKAQLGTNSQKSENGNTTFIEDVRKELQDILALLERK